MILTGCGGAGFALVASYRYQQQSLQQLLCAVEYMICDLQYRMTPLPELCENTSQAVTGCVSKVLLQLHTELEKQVIPNAAACMHVTLTQHGYLPDRLKKGLDLLGTTLGLFDLQGQLQGLESVKKHTEYEIDQLRRNQDMRLRNYRTIGICAGAALVIFLL